MADVVADCSLCTPLLYAKEQCAIQQVLGCSSSNAVIALTPAGTCSGRDWHCGCVGYMSFGNKLLGPCMYARGNVKGYKQQNRKDDPFRTAVTTGCMQHGGLLSAC